MSYPVKQLTHTRAHLGFAGVVDECGRELTHAHLREALHDILGRPLIALIQHVGAEHPDTLDAFHARVRGRWHIDRYDAPLEYYAAKLSQDTDVPFTEEQLAADPMWIYHQPALRYRAMAMLARDKKNDSSEFEEEFTNLFTINGVNFLWSGVTQAAVGAANTGGSSAATNAILNATQARIGVGDNATGGGGSQVVATNSDTDLNTIRNGNSGTTHAYWQVVTGAPVVSQNTITFAASYTTAIGNFAWGEFAVDNCGGSNATTSTRSGGTMMDHLISSQGTKVSGQTWSPSLVLSVS